MSKMSVLSRGGVIVTVLALALGAFAFTRAYAQAPATSTTSTQVNTQFMQNSWKRELSALGFDNLVLRRIDKVLEAVGQHSHRDNRVSGKLELTLKDVDLLLAKAQSIAAAHAGFDAKGAITDQAQALKSIQSLGAILDQLRGTFIYRLEHLFQ